METILSSYTNTHRHTWAYWPYKKLINICIYTVRLQLWLIIFTTFLLFEHWDATWQGHYKTPHGRATTRRHMAGSLQDATWQGHYKMPHGRVTTRHHKSEPQVKKIFWLDRPMMAQSHALHFQWHLLLQEVMAFQRQLLLCNGITPYPEIDQEVLAFQTILFWCLNVMACMLKRRHVNTIKDLNYLR